ncbi:hypothetical protein, partial [Methylogaea oryzae]|uniref:hypothetical protein n=1 Tax=Methylogaea oryzae TaxID=1295382 RepID=UPI003570CF86
RDGALALLAALDDLTPSERGMVWLTAYERHYREAIFSTIAANRERGPWARRDSRPDARSSSAWTTARKASAATWKSSIPPWKPWARPASSACPSTGRAWTTRR